MHISTDARLRKNKINFKVANKSAVDTINNVVKAQTGVAVEPVKGIFLMVTPLSIAGTDKQGHHRWFNCY